MKRLFLAFGALALVAAAVEAPQSAENASPAAVGSRTFISATQVAERMAKAEAAAGRPPDGSLVETGTYRGVMQYLTAPMKIYSQHEDDDEFFVVLEGSGTIVLGAQLVNPRRGTGATTLIADSGIGGVTHKLMKGDMFLLPVHSSRSVTQVDGRLVMMSMRLPHPAEYGAAVRP